ncbi:MAG: M1 family peptidase, partial [Flavobacteriaceae bacterium]|nr:M1 family peptidase [Flavobacteriaceae bacterium]
MKLKVLLPFLLAFFSIFAQEKQFTRQDTLRGSITKERAWWNLLHYELSVKVDPTEKMIEGSNTIRYKVLENNNRMQIDLQPPMEIISAKQNDQNLTFTREGNVYYITLNNNQLKDSIYTLTLDFKGKPKISKRPPWDDGFTWSKDSKGNDFIATSCQGGGASIWWPNKDHMYDEPDNGITMHITTPQHLMGVGNGRLINTIQNNDSTKTFTWNVVNPINNYGVNVNIGDYVHFGEKYQGEKGELDCDYYVLTENLEKAKEQFKQASKMLEAFEHWFGPYPFYEDSFKLVEVPYLGMEHQSS